MLKRIGYWAGVAVIGTVVGFSLQFAKAWTEPTAAPPTGNVGAPLNTGSVAQGRMGNLGIGTTTPGDRLHVEGAVRIRSGAPQLKMYESDNSENYYNLVVDGGRFGIRYNNGYPGPFQIEYNGNVSIGNGGLTVNGDFKFDDKNFSSVRFMNLGEDSYTNDTCAGNGEWTWDTCTGGWAWQSNPYSCTAESAVVCLDTYVTSGGEGCNASGPPSCSGYGITHCQRNVNCQAAAVLLK